MPAVHLVVTDEPSATRRLRRLVESMARVHGLGPEACFDLKVAASEALANALEHGSADGRAVAVALVRRGDALEVEVEDAGPALPPDEPDGGRGRGIPLMLALADEVQFESAAEGTRVRIRKRIRPPAGGMALQPA